MARGSALDPELLADGDRRNVVDRYRYWTVEAIVADLDRRRHPFHVAIENFGHDLNIGTVVRTANAFLAAEVHIVGRRRWNRRGAMVTDRYQHLRHHADVAGLLAFAAGRGAGRRRASTTGPGAVPIETADAARAVPAAVRPGGAGADRGGPRRPRPSTVSIAQFGSTRSINAGVAAGIAMHAWIRQHADLAARELAQAGQRRVGVDARGRRKACLDRLRTTVRTTCDAGPALVLGGDDVPGRDRRCRCARASPRPPPRRRRASRGCASPRRVSFQALSGSFAALLEPARAAPPGSRCIQNLTRIMPSAASVVSRSTISE